MSNKIKLPRLLHGIAHTFTEWRRQEAWQREHFPIRFFIWKAIPQWFRVKQMRLSDIYYQIRSWFLPFNVIKIKTLTRTYNEPYEVLLHGAFQVLVDLIEKEYIPFHEAWHEKEGLRAEDVLHPRLEDFLKEYSDGHQPGPEEIEALKAQAHWEGEMLDLYNWWKYERPLREEAEEKSWEDNPTRGYPIESLCVLDLDENHPLKKKWHEFCDKRWRAEEFAKKEDETQLLRLVKIRLHLWH